MEGSYQNIADYSTKIQQLAGFSQLGKGGFQSPNKAAVIKLGSFESEDKYMSSPLDISRLPTPLRLFPLEPQE